jgi:hypothetical protein
MDYVIAIPSYNRPDGVKKKTLAMLARHGIDKERIHIFVASNEQNVLYTQANPDYKIITAQLGLANARNFISDYFPIGKPIMSFDDDITEIKQKAGVKMEIIPNLHNFILTGFATCVDRGRRMFGLYPVANGMFMKDNLRDGLQLCVGGVWGILNPGPELRITVEYKEDYERCILMYLKDGGVIRFDNVTLATVFYKGQGGMVDVRTKELVAEAANTLLTRYPQFVKPRKSTKLGYVEIGLVCK